MTDLSVNDTFPDISQFKSTIESHINTHPYKFTTPLHRQKSITYYCIGRSAFQCDATYHAILRKKDGMWVLKKMKITHKCPIQVHEVGVDHFLADTLKNVLVQMWKEWNVQSVLLNKDDSCVDVPRIGWMMKVLEERSLKVCYESVYLTYLFLRDSGFRRMCLDDIKEIDYLGKRDDDIGLSADSIKIEENKKFEDDDNLNSAESVKYQKKRLSKNIHISTDEDSLNHSEPLGIINNLSGNDHDENNSRVIEIKKIKKRNKAVANKIEGDICKNENSDNYTKLTENNDKTIDIESKNKTESFEKESNIPENQSTDNISLKQSLKNENVYLYKKPEENDTINLEEDLLNDFPTQFCNEFKTLNKTQNYNLECNTNHIYIQFNDLKDIVRNVLEVKVVETYEGFVVYGIVYDANDYPIIYSILSCKIEETEDEKPETQQKIAKISRKNKKKTNENKESIGDDDKKGIRRKYTKRGDKKNQEESIQIKRKNNNKDENSDENEKLEENNNNKFGIKKNEKIKKVGRKKKIIDAGDNENNKILGRKKKKKINNDDVENELSEQNIIKKVGRKKKKNSCNPEDEKKDLKKVNKKDIKKDSSDENEETDIINAKKIDENVIPLIETKLDDINNKEECLHKTEDDKSKFHNLYDCLKLFFSYIDLKYFYIITEFNKDVFDALEPLIENKIYKMAYIVKTRDILKEFFKIEKSRFLVEKLFGICNGFIKRINIEEDDELNNFQKHDDKENIDNYSLNILNDRVEYINKENEFINRANIDINQNQFINRVINEVNQNEFINKLIKENEYNEINQKKIMYENDKKIHKYIKDEACYLDAETYDKIINTLKGIYPLKEERFINKYNLFNLQNIFESDLEYINTACYTFPFIETFNSITSLLKTSINNKMDKTILRHNFSYKIRSIIEKNRKIGEGFKIKKDSEDGLRNSVRPQEIIEYKQNKKDKLTPKIKIDDKIHESTFTVISEDDGAEFTIDLKNMKCSCKRFQNMLIPCVHACALVNDPYDYVSVVYSNEMFDFEYNIMPVIKDTVKQNERGYKRGGARYKKRKNLKLTSTIEEKL